jgi:glycogen debranching enzyme
LKTIPLGLTFSNEGATFSVYSEHATVITFCTFENGLEKRRIPLKRIGKIHTAKIPALKPGTRYGLRADGPWAPLLNHRFDSKKLLLDPYATAIDGSFTYDDRLAMRGVETAPIVPKAIATPQLPDLPLRNPHKPDVIYELQVRAFTMRHPDVPENIRGTVAALKHPSIIAHIKTLGVDTIELMPITAWIDERHLAKLGLRNAWGYNPLSFFAPEPRLAPGGMQEIRDTVAELHKHGFNVILDMVYNHSGEGDADGPVLSFRGLENSVYYAHHNDTLINDTGCGNTFALNREPMLSLVIASLRHWVLKAGIDGFRFDLATIMGRTKIGYEEAAPLMMAIENDPVLSTRIMIAEPWDIGPGGYQLGHFPKRWYEWNDKYRDDVRRFWRGDDFAANAMATRLAGSSDVFAHKGSPTKTINFIAAHDGFTLRDLTAFTHKQNLANGENNRDGKNEEMTCLGRNPASLLATLFMSRGVALLTAGDEFGRTQAGNNNAYAQDNGMTWLDWENTDKVLIAETAKLIASRKNLPLTDEFIAPGDARWLDALDQPVNWNAPQIPVLKLVIPGKYSIALDRIQGTVKVAAEN